MTCCDIILWHTPICYWCLQEWNRQVLHSYAVPGGEALSSHEMLTADHWRTFLVCASDSSWRFSMIAAAEVVVGLTENLFSSRSSSFNSSLSAFSLSIAALEKA